LTVWSCVEAIVGGEVRNERKRKSRIIERIGILEVQDMFAGAVATRNRDSTKGEGRRAFVAW
jgi:hypothetical protein